jgi:transposase, IS30 family
MQKRNKISPLERDQIALWHSQNLSLREIAKKLDRNVSSISREIKRNSFGEYYVAIHAQAQFTKRIAKARTRHPLKNKSVYAYVLKKLRSGWSPEQIAGRLKLMKGGNPYWHIHHETIYRFIYSKENKHKMLWEYLPRKQKKRRKKYGRKTQRVRIPDRVSIHDRPSEVESREMFGHWEGDSVINKAHKGGMHTEVERKTRFTMATFLKSREASETAQVASKMFNNLPKEAKKSTTLDNGLEFVKHKEFGVNTYFADTYASWQRGTNENTNGLIRRYLPKKTDFSKVTQKELNDIIEEINNRPRKCLGFYTPREMFEKELQTIRCCDSN